MSNSFKDHMYIKVWIFGLWVHFRGSITMLSLEASYEHLIRFLVNKLLMRISTAFTNVVIT